jgi:hypothetical protein
MNVKLAGPNDLGTALYSTNGIAARALTIPPPKMNHLSHQLSDILFVLVTCTQERTRERGLNATIASINQQHELIPFDGNLFVFDNASSITEPLRNLKAPALFGKSPDNIGYWAALLWTVRNFSDAAKRSFKYIHPIESDLIVHDLPALAEAKRFLDEKSDFATVRTQEFSVPMRFFYYKHRWNPFRIQRSQVSNLNAVTNEKVRFTRAVGFEKIYETNWHAKVPALHRWEPFAHALEMLARKPSLSEHDFMREMHRQHPKVAVLDGGAWWIHTGFAEMKEANTQMTGSYTPPDLLAQHGYRTTRVDSIPERLPDIAIGSEWK